MIHVNETTTGIHIHISGATKKKHRKTPVPTQPAKSNGFAEMEKLMQRHMAEVKALRGLISMEQEVMLGIQKWVDNGTPLLTRLRSLATAGSKEKTSELQRIDAQIAELNKSWT